MSAPPLGAETSTLVGAGLNAAPDAQETPTSWLDVTVDRASDFGTAAEVGVPWIPIPPKMTVPVLAPFPVTVVFLMSKPAPSRRMPPAVLLLTRTWSSRKMSPVSAQTPGEPPVMVRARM